MPVSLPRRMGLPGRTGFCHSHPDRRDWLESLGLCTARDFLNLSGVVVSGHVGRNVARVQLGATTGYLKREHRVRWRDRFRGWRDGFGWVSVSAREAAVLRHLEANRLPGPRWLAYGEADGQAFLLLEAAAGTVDLRSLPVVPDSLAGELGRVAVRLHAAGVDQPDLFAKHVLADSAAPSVVILDWQRAVLRARVPWRNRARGLAALRATLPSHRMTDRTWEALMAGYLAEVDTGSPHGRPPARFRAWVNRASAALAGRPTIRRQVVTTPAGTQELVRIGGERVCAVPAAASLFASDAAIAAAYGPTTGGREFPLPGGRSGLLRSRRYALPFARLWAALRGRSWRSPELRTARLLFHLERHGIPAPKLLAYGQLVPKLFAAGSFVLSEPLSGEPVGRTDESAVCWILERLHGAGCRLTDVGSAGEPFGSADGRVVISDPARVRLVRRLTRRQAARDRARVAAFFRALQ